MSKGVHRTHCCNIHGCKYGDKDCPVVNGTISQDYPCEQCSLGDYSLGRIERIEENTEFEKYNQKVMLKEVLKLMRLELLTKQLILEYQTHNVMLPDTIDKINELMEEGKR